MGAHGHQVVNFLHLASVKQLRKYASYTVTLAFERGTTAEDIWGGACPRKTPYGPAWLHVSATELNLSARLPSPAPPPGGQE